jgi:rod shape-determining protein MreB
MVVDIGGGTTEVAVISLAGIVTSQSVRIAGEKIDEAIVSFVRRYHGMLIGDRTAEEIKLTVGSAYPLQEEVSMQISGLPRQTTLSSIEVREAIAEPIAQIVEAVKQALERTPPELAADIMDSGICLAGGGALLRGLDELIHQATEMPVFIAEDPLTCVAMGCGMILDEVERVPALRHALIHANS